MVRRHIYTSSMFKTAKKVINRYDALNFDVKTLQKQIGMQLKNENNHYSAFWKM